MIAGLASALGAQSMAGVSPITDQPDFAALREEGLKKLHTGACARKLVEIAKRLARPVAPDQTPGSRA